MRLNITELHNAELPGAEIPRRPDNEWNISYVLRRIMCSNSVETMLTSILRFINSGKIIKLWHFINANKSEIMQYRTLEHPWTVRKMFRSSHKAYQGIRWVFVILESLNKHKRMGYCKEFLFLTTSENKTNGISQECWGKFG